MSNNRVQRSSSASIQKASIFSDIQMPTGNLGNSKSQRGRVGFFDLGGIMTEYLFIKLPQGIVPKSVSFEAVVSMELTELGGLGWKVTAAGRAGSGFTPLEVVLERSNNE